ncbi:helix-turn-helix domain-containing protein [Legionella taurinensis]|uniref:Helix-turn-helix domain-containing protein n=2 Tax=Legionella taurinensis TaxID=70611 RepID=A0AB38N7W0_9GAMM|nr:peptidase S24 [Legionella taurinensis]PUT45193.1 peptidase S24 [Legionella taurinensis]PUT45710.1 peptidase S24 [Legionella taurinensis]PUT49478.1 peptidase S24 [Legionella taurinensis]TID34970.1 helix-turn-helix domain-containing protein [Legionella taurinensis]
MKHNKVSESDLARALNVPYNTIHRLVNGHTTDPRLSTLKLIATYFNVSLDTLLTYHENNVSEYHNNNLKAVPIISWEKVTDSILLNSINNKNWNHWLPIPLTSLDNLSLNAYALESRPSMQPRFPLGTFFIIDPKCDPIDGDLVLVKIKANNAVSLRELIMDPPTTKLLPLIQSSEALNFNGIEHEIIGVIVLTMHHLRRS